MSPSALQTLSVAIQISEESLAKLRKNFKTVHYYPSTNDSPNPIPAEALRETEILFARWLGIPPYVKSAEEIPNLKIVQLSSAGANKALENPLFKEEKIAKQVSICSASGIHVLSIPQYIIGSIVSLYMNLHTQHYLCRANARWPKNSEYSWGPVEGGTNSPFVSMRGKTAGLLGYGHIARETARLLKAFNVNVIAANSSGTQREDDGYIIPNTGDKDGSIPSEYYSSTDPESFAKFLSKSDILIASLPSTPATRFLLKAKHLALLPQGAIFINVGRGDLVSSEDLLEALNSKDEGLFGAALDVTNPEPLPDGHPLFTHPRVIITPHTSGDFAGYFEAGADLLLANVERVRGGGKPFNVVDPAKGY